MPHLQLVLGHVDDFLEAVGSLRTSKATKGKFYRRHIYTLVLVPLQRVSRLSPVILSAWLPQSVASSGSTTARTIRASVQRELGTPGRTRQSMRTSLSCCPLQSMATYTSKSSMHWE